MISITTQTNNHTITNLFLFIIMILVHACYMGRLENHQYSGCYQVDVIHTNTDSQNIHLFISHFVVLAPCVNCIMFSESIHTCMTQYVHVCTLSCNGIEHFDSKDSLLKRITVVFMIFTPPLLVVVEHFLTSYGVKTCAWNGCVLSVTPWNVYTCISYGGNKILTHAPSVEWCTQ